MMQQSVAAVVGCSYALISCPHVLACFRPCPSCVRACVRTCSLAFLRTCVSLKFQVHEGATATWLHASSSSSSKSGGRQSSGSRSGNARGDIITSGECHPAVPHPGGLVVDGWALPGLLV